MPKSYCPDTEEIQTPKAISLFRERERCSRGAVRRVRTAHRAVATWRYLWIVESRERL